MITKILLNMAIAIDQTCPAIEQTSETRPRFFHIGFSRLRTFVGRFLYNLEKNPNLQNLQALLVVLQELVPLFGLKGLNLTTCQKKNIQTMEENVLHMMQNFWFKQINQGNVILVIKTIFDDENDFKITASLKSFQKEIFNDLRYFWICEKHNKPVVSLLTKYLSKTWLRRFQETRNPRNVKSF